MLLLPLFLPLLLSLFPPSLSDDLRVDCSPDPGHGLFSTEEMKCKGRKCKWESVPKGNPHRLPECVRPHTSAYTETSRGNNTIQLKFNGLKNDFDDGAATLNVSFTHLGDALRVKMAAPGSYEPPLGLPMSSSPSSSDSLSFVPTVIPGTDEFAFKVVRDSTGTVLWDTTIGGFFYGSQFLEIATYLPSAHIFGLGERVSTKLMHDTSTYWDYPMLATARLPDLKKTNLNLNGVHPFYLCVENDGKAHGVLMLNSNAQEVVMGPVLTYRSVGGVFDLAFFPGPSPDDVIRQYQNYVGKPYLPAYWALGYQYGRNGYKGVDALRLAVNRYLYHKIPLDVVQLDADVRSEGEMFTLGKDWSDLPAYVDTLHSMGIKATVEADPTLAATSHALERAKNKDVSFVTWIPASKLPKINSKYPLTTDTDYMLGGSSLLPTPAVFIDFLDPLVTTNQWWSQEFQQFRQTLRFDGISLNRNEPLNEGKELDCPKNDLDHPPYELMGNSESVCLCEESLCMEGKTTRTFSNFYDTRNLFGWAQSKSTKNALEGATQKRGSLLSRSTFVSSGRYTGHWLDGSSATWDDLKAAIIGALNFNMFGIPLVGSDICGSRGKPSAELCLRWHQLGAFHPLTRSNHDSSEDVDPSSFPDIIDAVRLAVQFKYTYTPYLYSLMYSASRTGSTVLRPLFFSFPADVQALSIDYQFMWGQALMISPVVEAGASTVRTYFPSASWYSLSPEAYGSQMSSVYYQDVPAKTNSLTPVFIRGGNIIPRQPSNATLAASRVNPLELLIAVEKNQMSTGELYWDRGDDLVADIEAHQRQHWTFNFTTNPTYSQLTGICEKCDKSLPIPNLAVIEVFGCDYRPNLNSVTLNGVQKPLNLQISTYSPITRRLVLASPNLIPFYLVYDYGINLVWYHQ